MSESTAEQSGDLAVHDLIAKADAHPLGRDFLLEGALDAVAATFAVHAFTVDRARELITSRPARVQAKNA